MGVQRVLLSVSRAVLSLVLVLAVVPAASASRAGGEISHCKTYSSGLSVSDRLARPRDLDLSLSYALETSVTGPRVRWILSLRNRSPRALRLSFPSSQYANVVLRQGGKIIYSWSANRGFAAVVSGRRLGARATYVCSLGPDPLDVEPGRYELIAHLAGKTKPALTRRSLLVRG